MNRLRRPLAGLATVLAVAAYASAQWSPTDSPIRFGNVGIRPPNDRVFDVSGLPESTPADAGLTVALVDQPPSPDAVVVKYVESDAGGNTSVSNDTVKTIKHSSVGKPGYFVADRGAPAKAWKEVAYFKRSRDLGQTFTYNGPQACRLDAITLRTGYGSNVVRSGTFGAAVSLQLFEVSGEPALRDNGTHDGNGAAHGFPHRVGEIAAERDDYLEGEVYRSLAVARGGRFPAREDFGLDAAAAHRPDHDALRGRLLRFDVSGGAEIMLRPGVRYAFLVIIDGPGPERGFTLANRYYGRYLGGHGVRREGDGVMPPEPADPASPVDAIGNRQALAAARLPSDFGRRTSLPPGTRGFPDVDTHRDLYFFVEAAMPRTRPNRD